MEDPRQGKPTEEALSPPPLLPPASSAFPLTGLDPPCEDECDGANAGMAEGSVVMGGQASCISSSVASPSSAVPPGDVLDVREDRSNDVGMPKCSANPEEPQQSLGGPHTNGLAQLPATTESTLEAPPSEVAAVDIPLPAEPEVVKEIPSAGTPDVGASPSASAATSSDTVGSSVDADSPSELPARLDSGSALVTEGTQGGDDTTAPVSAASGVEDKRDSGVVVAAGNGAAASEGGMQPLADDRSLDYQKRTQTSVLPPPPPPPPAPSLPDADGSTTLHSSPPPSPEMEVSPFRWSSMAPGSPPAPTALTSLDPSAPPPQPPPPPSEYQPVESDATSAVAGSAAWKPVALPVGEPRDPRMIRVKQEEPQYYQPPHFSSGSNTLAGPSGSHPLPPSPMLSYETANGYVASSTAAAPNYPYHGSAMMHHTEGGAAYGRGAGHMLGGGLDAGVPPPTPPRYHYQQQPPPPPPSSYPAPPLDHGPRGWDIAPDNAASSHWGVATPGVPPPPPPPRTAAEPPGHHPPPPTLPPGSLPQQQQQPQVPVPAPSSYPPVSYPVGVDYYQQPPMPHPTALGTVAVGSTGTGNPANELVIASVVLSLLVTCEGHKLVNRGLEQLVRQHLPEGSFTTKEFREAVGVLEDVSIIVIRPESGVGMVFLKVPLHHTTAIGLAVVHLLLIDSARHTRWADGSFPDDLLYRLLVSMPRGTWGPVSEGVAHVRHRLRGAGLLDETGASCEWVKLRRTDLPLCDIVALLGADMTELQRRKADRQPMSMEVDVASARKRPLLSDSAHGSDDKRTRRPDDYHDRDRDRDYRKVSPRRSTSRVKEEIPDRGRSGSKHESRGGGGTTPSVDMKYPTRRSPPQGSNGQGRSFFDRQRDLVAMPRRSGRSRSPHRDDARSGRDSGRDESRSSSGGALETYGQLKTRMDREIGRLRSDLDELHKEKDTLRQRLRDAETKLRNEREDADKATWRLSDRAKIAERDLDRARENERAKDVRIRELQHDLERVSDQERRRAHSQAGERILELEREVARLHSKSRGMPGAGDPHMEEINRARWVTAEMQALERANFFHLERARELEHEVSRLREMERAWQQDKQALFRAKERINHCERNLADAQPRLASLDRILQAVGGSSNQPASIEEALRVVGQTRQLQQQQQVWQQQQQTQQQGAAPSQQSQERGAVLEAQLERLREESADMAQEYNSLSSLHFSVTAELNEARRMLLAVADKYPGSLPTKWFCRASDDEIKEALQAHLGDTEQVTSPNVYRAGKMVDEYLRNPGFDPFVRKNGAVGEVDEENPMLKKLVAKFGEPLGRLLVEKRREIERHCPSGHYPVLELWSDGHSMTVPQALKAFLDHVKHGI